MNFSSLKRRLFDKRGKKKSKSECSVYILDSPPDLLQKKNIPSEHVPYLSKDTSANSSDPSFEKGVVKVGNFKVVADVHREGERRGNGLTLNDIGNGDFENKHVKREKVTSASSGERTEKKVSPLFCVQKPIDNKTSSNAKNVNDSKATEKNPVVGSAKEGVSFADIVNKLSYVKSKEVTPNNRETTVIENIRELEKLKHEIKYLPVKSPHKKDDPFGKQSKTTSKTRSQSEKGMPFKTSLKPSDNSETVCQKGESIRKVFKTTNESQPPCLKNITIIDTPELIDKTNVSFEKGNQSKTLLKGTEQSDTSNQSEKTFKTSVKSTDVLQPQCHDQNTAIKTSERGQSSFKKDQSLNGSTESNAPAYSSNGRENAMSKTPYKTVDFEDLDYDLVSVAFRHSIIPEKLQATGEDIEVMIQKCFLYALKREREKSEITDPIDDVSPLIEELKTREKERDKKAPKKAITKVAFEAAFMQHECDKMIHSCNQMNLPSKRSLKHKDIETLSSTLKTVKEDFAIIVKYFQRLKEYSRHSEKLVPLIIYRTPVYDHLDDTMSDLIDVLTDYKKITKYMNNKIETLAEEARKKSELVRNTEDRTCDQSVAREDCSQEQNEEIGVPTNDKDSTDKQANLSLEKGSTSNKEVPQPSSDTGEPQTTNTPRKKSWKANRASELRCAVSSSNGQTSRRIIAPISRDSVNEKQSDPSKTRDVIDSSPKEKSTNVSTNDKTSETTRESGKLTKTGGHENSEREEVQMETGGGDGLNVSCVRGIATSTPKKNARTNHGNTPNKCPNAVSRRMLISGEKANIKTNTTVNKATTNFRDEDEEIVSSFCDGGDGCLDEVDVDDIDEDDASTADGLDKDIKAKNVILAQNAAVMNDLMNKSAQCDKHFNNSLNSTYGSNMTGNNTRDFSDLSKSFTSYIETNNTFDFSSLEVKPTHGDRVNKKKLQAEIKPKKKKTRGIPNQHLEPKSIPKVKSDVDDDFKTEKKGKETTPDNVGFVEEVLDKEEKKARSDRFEHSKVESKQGEFVPKPMNYEYWQTIDQREILMVPEQVHYQGESKLKDVEDMYTVASAKGKKKKKKKEKKTKTKQNNDGSKHSDDEFFM